MTTKLADLFVPADLSVATSLFPAASELPMLGAPGYERLYERVSLAIVTLSEGNIDKLRRWIDLAKLDWRDVLVAAGTANEL